MVLLHPFQGAPQLRDLGSTYSIVPETPALFNTGQSIGCANGSAQPVAPRSVSPSSVRRGAPRCGKPLSPEAPDAPPPGEYGARGIFKHSIECLSIPRPDTQTRKRGQNSKSLWQLSNTLQNGRFRVLCGCSQDAGEGANAAIRPPLGLARFLSAPASIRCRKGESAIALRLAAGAKCEHAPSGGSPAQIPPFRT